PPRLPDGCASPTSRAGRSELSESVPGRFHLQPSSVWDRSLPHPGLRAWGRDRRTPLAHKARAAFACGTPFLGESDEKRPNPTPWGSAMSIRCTLIACQEISNGDLLCELCDLSLRPLR